MENSGDILSSLLQNPETLNLIAGIAKSFLSANVSMAKNTENPPPVNQSTEHSENTVQTAANASDNTDFSGENSVSGNSGANQSTVTPETLSAAVNAMKMLSGSNVQPSSQSKAPEQPLNASAVIDAPNVHNSFDERANLLRSIKPYLKDDRQQKVDSLVKALNIAKLINSYTGSSGLFGK